MTSLGEEHSEPPTRKKKKAATKRKILNIQENIPLASIYSVSSISKTFKPPPDNQCYSDEEENVEQFQAKLDARIKGKKPKKKKINENIISSDEDENVLITPEKSQEKKGSVCSPSPPPPPEFFNEKRQSKMDKMIRKLDTAFYDCKNMQYLHKLNAQSNASPSPSNSDADLDSSFERSRRKEIYVKVRTKHGLKRFNIGMHEPLINIIIPLADQENVDISRISLTRGADDFSENDTPHSRDLLVTDILDCVVIDPSNISAEDYSHLISEEDKVELKFQGQEKRSALTMKIVKDDNFRRSFQSYSNFISIPTDKLKFIFDGEDIRPTDTPESLDMEGQGTIDVILL